MTYTRFEVGLAGGKARRRLPRGGKALVVTDAVFSGAAKLFPDGCVDLQMKPLSKAFGGAAA